MGMKKYTIIIEKNNIEGWHSNIRLNSSGQLLLYPNSRWPIVAYDWQETEETSIDCILDAVNQKLGISIDDEFSVEYGPVIF